MPPFKLQESSTELQEAIDKIQKLPLDGDIAKNVITQNSNTVDNDTTNSVIIGSKNSTSAGTKFAYIWGDRNAIQDVITAGTRFIGRIFGAFNKIIGESSSDCFIDGRFNKASGQRIFVEGYYNDATGSGIHAEGDYNTVSGDGIHIEGSANTSDGYYSHVEGINNTNHGAYAHVEGTNNTNHGAYAHVEGGTNEYHNTNMSVVGHVEGYNNRGLSTAYAVHIEGGNNEVSGVSTRTHVEGAENTVIKSQNSHVEGYSNRAENNNIIHIEGRDNVGTGNACHVEGKGNTVTSANGHAGGEGNVVTSTNGFAHGKGLKNSKANKTVVGQFNRDVDGAIFEVGTGKDENNRRTQFYVTEDGYVYITDWNPGNTAEIPDSMVCLQNELDRIFTNLGNKSFTLNIANIGLDDNGYISHDDYFGLAAAIEDSTIINLHVDNTKLDQFSAQVGNVTVARYTGISENDNIVLSFTMMFSSTVFKQVHIIIDEVAVYPEQFEGQPMHYYSVRVI